MKQKDIFLIAVIVIVSAVASVIISKLIIAPPKNRQQAVEVVAPIDSTFNEPDKKYFTTTSINPTKLIQIGDNSNNNPFNSKQ